MPWFFEFWINWQLTQQHSVTQLLQSEIAGFSRKNDRRLVSRIDLKFSRKNIPRPYWLSANPASRLRPDFHMRPLYKIQNSNLWRIWDLWSISVWYGIRFHFWDSIHYIQYHENMKYSMPLTFYSIACEILHHILLILEQCTLQPRLLLARRCQWCSPMENSVRSACTCQPLSLTLWFVEQELWQDNR